MLIRCRPIQEILVMLFLAGSSGYVRSAPPAKSAQSSKSPFKREAAKVLSIKPGPHMTSEEAGDICWLYFVIHIGTPCFIGESVDEGDTWACTPNTGDDCSPDKNPIRVKKTSGRVSWGSGPTYESPQALAKAALSFRSVQPVSQPKRH